MTNEELISKTVQAMTMTMYDIAQKIEKTQNPTEKNYLVGYYTAFQHICATLENLKENKFQFITL